jgi:amino acid permease
VGAVLGLINGMVGSLIIFLPVLALSSGYAASAIIITVSGFSFVASSWLYLQHLGEEPDIGLAMKKHFKGRNAAKNIYEFLSWFYIIIVCVQYFQLTGIQWEILIP